jgi:hypothetical protein
MLDRHTIEVRRKRIGGGGFGNWDHNSSKEREIRDISNSKGELLWGGRKEEERPGNRYVMQTSSESQDEGELIVVPGLDLIAIADDELDTSGDDNIVSKDRRWWWWWSRVCWVEIVASSLLISWRRQLSGEQRKKKSASLVWWFPIPDSHEVRIRGEMSEQKLFNRFLVCWGNNVGGEEDHTICWAPDRTERRISRSGVWSWSTEKKVIDRQIYTRE